jgi:hypothetical protein
MRRMLPLFALLLPSLISCATTTPPRTVVTVELFDSRALTSAASAETTQAWAAPTFVSTAGELALAPGDATREQPKTEPNQALKLPQEPRAASPVDVALAAPVRPRAGQAFPLAAPMVPAAGPRQAPAAKSSQSAPTGSIAAPAKSLDSPKPGTVAAKSAPATATAPAAPPVAAATGATSATAPSTAAPAPSTAAAAAAASTAATGGSQSARSQGDSYGRLREIFARQGDEVQVGLDGAGFLFLGFPDRSPLADGMAFKGKENRNAKTWFTFKALKIGVFDLDFLQQQNATGTSAKETVRVHVVSDTEFASAVNQKPEESQPGSVAGETGDPAFAEKLTSLGQYEAAVGELLKGYKEGNPGLNDQIATLYMRMHSWDAAGKYYTKNLTGAYASRAVLGLVQVAVAQKDQQLLMTCLKPFLAIREPQAEEPLIQATRMERDKSEIGVGMDLAGEYAARFPSGAWVDEARFLLAQFLEADSPFRDIARSRDTYRDLLKTHPESAYANPARERLRYIERHFYQVR